MSDPLFFAPARFISAGELAEAVGAVLATRELAATHLEGIAAIDDGRPGTVVYADGSKQVGKLASTRASAVICRQQAAGSVRGGVAVLVSERPQESFARAAGLFHPSAVRPVPFTGEPGISPGAHLSPDAEVEEGAVIETGAVIGAGARIGRGTIVGPGAAIGRGCQIGRDCYIGPGATIQYALIGNRVSVHPGVRIGQDGFGYVPGSGVKVPQVGRVIIQDDVEIGANTTIDRGAMGDTIIGERTKIDNLVQVGHNVKIGRGCVIAAQCGISGSVTIGDHVMLGGQVGMSDHIAIGDRARIAAQSGLMNDVPAGEAWFGSPAQPISAQMREIALVRSLARSKRKKNSGNE